MFFNWHLLHYVVQLKTKAVSCIKGRLSADLSEGSAVEAVVLGQVPQEAWQAECVRGVTCVGGGSRHVTLFTNFEL